MDSTDWAALIAIVCRAGFAGGVMLYGLVANVQDFHKSVCCFMAWYIMNEWVKRIND